MERWEAKILSLFVCLLALFSAVALPIKVSQLFYSQGKRGERWLDIVNCFGGGVFLGTYLITFPQVRTLIEDALLKPSHLHYPLPEVLVGAGFFLIMFLEKTISSLNNRSSKKAKDEERDDEPSVQGTELKTSATVLSFIDASSDDEIENSARNPYSNNVPIKGPEMSRNDVDHVENAADGLGDSGVTLSIHQVFNHNNNHGDDVHNNGLFINAHTNKAYVTDKNDPTEGVSRYAEAGEAQTNGGNGAVTSQPQTVTSQGEDGDQHPHHQHGVSDFSGALKALILMAALAIDNVFIGMGLGLRDTNIGVWNMLITILSHELVISFTLGLALVKHNSAKKTLLLAAVYASMCPIGIGIGTLLLDTGFVGEGVELVSGVLQALAAGVFLYVTFFEILEGHVGHNSNVPCLVAILAGFILMALLALLEEDASEETKVFHRDTSGLAHNGTSSPLILDVHQN